MSKQIVVIYTFSLKNGIADQQLIDASARLDGLLLTLEGFHYRSLTKTTDGLWQDIVYWESAEVLAKADSIEGDKRFDDMMGLIDMTTVKRESAELLSSVYPEMEAA